MILAEKEPANSPLWYVTNGAAVVGPVDTDLLLRGITSARIPDDCLVTQERWSAWRTLDQIREVSRVRRSFTWCDAVRPAVPDDLVRKAHDAGEALLFAMQSAATATRATASLVHRVREPFVGLVTSSAFGAGADRELGKIIPRFDAALARAALGEVFLGAPLDSEAHRAVSRRFADHVGDLRGVAAVPIFDGGNLLAMIELVRADHPFRSEDAALLANVARVVAMK